MSAAEAGRVPVTVSPLTSREITMAVAAVVIHMVAMIPGYNEDDTFQATEWLIIFAISAVVAAVVFWFPVRMASTGWAMGLAVCALVSVLAFWAGLTLPLAAGAVALALRSRARGDRPGLAQAALAVAVLAVIALAAIIIGDAIASD